MAGRDVFISFCFDDQSIADRIYEALIHAGISCWICTKEIPGGVRYPEYITPAIKASRLVVLLHSKNVFLSEEIKSEIGIAYNSQKLIYPFRIDMSAYNAFLEYRLSGGDINYIDASCDIENGILRLISDIKKHLQNDIEEDGTYHKLRSSKNVSISEVFAGRDAMIQSIHDSFNERSIIFLFGMGGIGKTEIIRHYWRQNKESYDTVIFARYDHSLASLVADDNVFNINGFVRKIGADNIPISDEDYAREKMAIIRKITNERTLIILDNFDIQVANEPFWDEFVSDAPFRLIITTRIRPDTKRYFSMPVSEIDDSALKCIFCEYAGGEMADISQDDPVLTDILELTNRHTYTLELVAKKMEQDGCDLDFMKHYLLQNGVNKIQVDTYKSISQLFHLSKLDEIQQYYLRCLSLMSPVGVSKRLFVEWIGDAQVAWISLARLGLVKTVGKTICLHPLIREVILNDLKPNYSNCCEFLHRISGLYEEFSNVWDLSYEDKKELLDNYKSIIAIIPEITEETYQMYCRFLWIYNFVGDFKETVNLSRRINAFAEKHYALVPEELFRIKNLIAWKCTSYDMWQQANTLYKEIADWYIDHPCYTSTDPLDRIYQAADTFTYLYTQGDCKDKYYLEQAYRYMDDALEYGQNMKKATANADEKLKKTVQNRIDAACVYLTKLYIAAGRYEEAGQQLAEIKRYEERNYPEQRDYPQADMASYYFYSFRIHYETGDFIHALNDIKRSYEITVYYFTERYPRGILRLGWMALCCAKLGMSEEAAKHKTKALSLAEELLAKDHPMYGWLKSIGN